MIDTQASFQNAETKGLDRDFTIRCQGHEWGVHKVAIFSRSSLLDRLYGRELARTKCGELELDEEEPEILRRVLLYIYTGRLEIRTPDKDPVSESVPDGYRLWSDWVNGPPEPASEDANMDDAWLDEYAADMDGLEVEKVRKPRLPLHLADWATRPANIADADSDYESVDSIQEESGDEDGEVIKKEDGEEDSTDDPASDEEELSDDEVDSEIKPEPFVSTHDLDITIALYSAADRLFVPRLKDEAQLVFEYFFDPLEWFDDLDKVVQIATSVYKATPESDRGLRDAFVSTFDRQQLLQLKKLIKPCKRYTPNPLTEKIAEVPGLAEDLLEQLKGKTRLWRRMGLY